MIALFAVVLCGLGIVTAALPKKEKSENENRSLQKLPTVVNSEKLKKAENPKDVWDSVKWKYLNNRDGSAFKDDFEKFLCDHMAGRELWVKAANSIQKASGKQEINGVYTLDNQMVQTFKGYDSEITDASINAINQFAARFPEKKMFFMLAPTAQEFVLKDIPSSLKV